MNFLICTEFQRKLDGVVVARDVVAGLGDQVVQGLDAVGRVKQFRTTAVARPAAGRPSAPAAATGPVAHHRAGRPSER